MSSTFTCPWTKTARWPLVLFIHGGAHMFGSRDELSPVWGISPEP